jgi:hypothetical protein
MTIASAPINSNANLPISWRIGEHVALVGDTGSGKTFLVSKLVTLRQYVVIFRTKPDDIKFPGFFKSNTAREMDGFHERILLTPKYREQAVEGFAMLERAWVQHNWTIIIDELWYVERLGLKPYVERLLTQGRSIKVSVGVGMQRPALISRFAISSCTHLFTFQLEGRDIQTVKEATTPRIVPVIEGLRGKDFAYYHRGKRIVATGNARRLGEIIK